MISVVALGIGYFFKAFLAKLEHVILKMHDLGKKGLTKHW